MITTIGIDPGVTGAIAIFQDGDLICVPDMPTIGNLVDTHEVRSLIAACCGEKHIVIEELGVRAGLARSQDVALMGRNFGRVETACSLWPTTIVRPQEWTKAVGRPKGKDYSDNKEQSRLLAIRLWPDMHELFARKKDAGRAEAALIGLSKHTERLLAKGAAA